MANLGCQEDSDLWPEVGRQWPSTGRKWGRRAAACALVFVQP
jgi:hypothetical protein